LQAGAIGAPRVPLQPTSCLKRLLLSHFLKCPVRVFFPQRLAIRFENDDPVGRDQ